MIIYTVSGLVLLLPTAGNRHMPVGEQPVDLGDTEERGEPAVSDARVALLAARDVHAHRSTVQLHSRHTHAHRKRGTRANRLKQTCT